MAIRLDAEIIISNTFATHYYALRDAGEAERFEEYNWRGIELATVPARNDDRYRQGVDIV